MSELVMRLAAFLVLVVPATAAGAAESSSASHPCAGVADPSERLACYDRAFPPTAGTEVLAEQAAQDFGLTAQEVRARNPALARAQPPDRIEATVVSVTGSPGAGRTFTLDNGQIWRQTDANVLGVVKVGDRVAIKDAAFSSFILITPGRVPLRVKRIE
ncbi:hypothetical protein [Vulcaniibacterium gelatinicum]|uniref:hypothetical protein n=1 Tax=Vulcaniibacterium gelatinicum TaxID=2598725 RepID=UPI0015F2D0E4|nr:hypothetical protein [Vulcaniibacterium gelatinicum]